jgi:hypothetical protein
MAKPLHRNRTTQPRAAHKQSTCHETRRGRREASPAVGAQAAVAGRLARGGPATPRRCGVIRLAERLPARPPVTWQRHLTQDFRILPHRSRGAAWLGASVPRGSRRLRSPCSRQQRRDHAARSAAPRVYLIQRSFFGFEVWGGGYLSHRAGAAESPRTKPDTTAPRCPDEATRLQTVPRSDPWHRRGRKAPQPVS